MPRPRLLLFLRAVVVVLLLAPDHRLDVRHAHAMYMLLIVALVSAIPLMLVLIVAAPTVAASCWSAATAALLAPGAAVAPAAAAPAWRGRWRSRILVRLVSTARSTDAMLRLRLLLLPAAGRRRRCARRVMERLVHLSRMLSRQQRATSCAP